MQGLVKPAIVVFAAVLVSGAVRAAELPDSHCGLPCVQPNPADGCSFGEAVFFLFYDDEEIDICATWQFAYASARSHFWYHQPCSDFGAYCAGGISDVDVYSSWCGSLVSADAYWPGGGEDCQDMSYLPGIAACKHSAVYYPVNDHWLLHAEGSVWRWGSSCHLPPPPPGGTWIDFEASGYGSGIAFSAVELEVLPHGRDGETWQGELLAMFWPQPASGGPNRIEREITMLLWNDFPADAAWRMGIGTLVIDSGLVSDPGDPNAPATQTTYFNAEPGVHELKLTKLTFTDAVLDVDGSGRFNQLDVLALGGMIDPNAPSDPNNPDPNTAAWDLNASGCIDEGDIAVMDWLVDLGLDSGIFADLDRNGEVDCDDLEGVDQHFGWDLDDDGYRIQLDENLDGETDDWDRHWVYQAVLQGDVDADGDVDIADLSALMDAYGSCDGQGAFNPYADVDRDGCVGSADMSALLTNYGLGCN